MASQCISGWHDLSKFGSFHVYHFQQLGESISLKECLNLEEVVYTVPAVQRLLSNCLGPGLNCHFKAF